MIQVWKHCSLLSVMTVTDHSAYGITSYDELTANQPKSSVLWREVSPLSVPPPPPRVMRLRMFTVGIQWVGQSCCSCSRRTTKLSCLLVTRYILSQPSSTMLGIVRVTGMYIHCLYPGIGNCKGKHYAYVLLSHRCSCQSCNIVYFAL